MPFQKVRKISSSVIEIKKALIEFNGKLLALPIAS
jgi:hypothetical protein